jgi:hypothetical protein
VIALIGFWLIPKPVEDKNAACDTATLTGFITPEIFHTIKDCLIRSKATNKTFVVKESGGGNWESALALGILIHDHGWNVEIVGLCASSCADFIFPAGKVKYLHDESLLLFHGGPHQQNLMAQAEAFDQASGSGGSPAPALELGHENKEGYAIRDLDPVTVAERRKVMEFLSMGDAHTGVEILKRLTARSDQFYEELGINPLLPAYGQMGSYEPIYKSYKKFGFMYRLDSLRRLGITGIELKDGVWHPERNRAYPDVYEVTYP